jgi:hypothetical protein
MIDYITITTMIAILGLNLLYLIENRQLRRRTSELHAACERTQKELIAAYERQTVLANAHAQVERELIAAYGKQTQLANELADAYDKQTRLADASRHG